MNNNSNNNGGGSSSALWHGLGLFGESYLLFSIGTLRPLWQELYPTCFSSDADNNNSNSSSCNNPFLTYNSLSYSVVLGVMLGMIIIGNLAGNIGRRKCSLLNASVMVGGATLLVIASCFLSGQFDNRYDYYSGQQQDIEGYEYDAATEGGGSNNNYSRPDVLFQVMSISLFIFGIGVGGEYPLSASLASERAMTALNERRRREEEEETRAFTTLGMENVMSSRLLTTATATTAVSSSYKNVAIERRQDDNGNNNSDNSQYYSWQTTTNNNHRAVVNNSSQWVENYNLNDEGEKDMQQQQQQQQRQQESLSKTRTRGKEVIFVFSMQGMGILANSLILTFLLLVTRRTNPQQQQQQQQDDNNSSSSHSQQTLLYIWRVIYIIGWFVLIYVLISRICYLDESEVWAKDQLLKQQQQQKQQQQRDDGGDRDGSHSSNMEENRQHHQQSRQSSSERQLLYKHYGTRLFGTSITWLLWDIAFYGNKLFQSTFLIALTGENASLVQISGASAINAFVALLGYYTAALIVDNPTVGRLRLQQFGFVITGTLFLMCGFMSDQLSSMTLVILYLGSSFFGQCGPNSTTFLIPAEVFPTE